MAILVPGYNLILQRQVIIAQLELQSTPAKWFLVVSCSHIFVQLL